MQDIIEKMSSWFGNNKNELVSAAAIVLGIVAALGVKISTLPKAKDE